jgi:hypothetical protein
MRFTTNRLIVLIIVIAGLTFAGVMACGRWMSEGEIRGRLDEIASSLQAR